MNFGYYPYQNNNLYQQQIAQMQQAQQSNTFVHVPSEEVARAYTVAPGGSVTFINDNAPYCYTKTAGFNQFDTPVFRKFRLVEETSSEAQKQPSEPSKDSAPKVTTDDLSSEIETIKTRIKALEDRLAEPQQNERRMKNESFKQRQQTETKQQP